MLSSSSAPSYLSLKSTKTCVVTEIDGYTRSATRLIFPRRSLPSTMRSKNSCRIISLVPGVSTTTKSNSACNSPIALQRSSGPLTMRIGTLGKALEIQLLDMRFFGSSQSTSTVENPSRTSQPTALAAIVDFPTPPLIEAIPTVNPMPRRYITAAALRN